MGRRSGFSLVEVLICIGLLATVIVPVLDMFMSSANVSHQSGRLVEVSLHAQMLLEALSQIEPHELPATEDNGEELVVGDDLPLNPADAGPRFKLWLASFRKKPPLPMHRVMVIKRLKSGEALLRLSVTWLGVEGDERTRQKISFRMITVPSVFAK